MGSEQSSQASRREREERERARWNNYREATSTAQAATAKDVAEALEKQRKLYEKKVKDLLEEQQKKLQQQKNEILQSSKQESIITTTGPQTQPTFNSTERQRTPYSYNQNELETGLNSSPRSLYPNLGASTSYQNRSSPTFCPSPDGYLTQTPTKNYVYVNSQFRKTEQPTRGLSPDFTPSAPPSETAANLPSKFKGATIRSRSQSRQRSQNDELKCPTCGQMFGERIYQCNNGHSSCELCKTRQVACGQCRFQLTNRRNYDLERYIVETLQKKVKCPNSTEGCCLYVKLAELDKHAKECPFNVQKCPSLGACNWNGKLSQLSSHFNNVHPIHLQGDVDKEMCIANIFETNHMMHYIRIGPFNFLFHMKVSEAEKRICMATQLIGTKHSAAKWTYEIHLFKKSEPRRKFHYFDRCTSSRDSIEEIMKSSKCAVLPVEYAKTFICNGVLNYKFFIKKDEATENSENDNSENKPKQNFKKYYGKKNKNSVG